MSKVRGLQPLLEPSLLRLLKSGARLNIDNGVVVLVIAWLSNSRGWSLSGSPSCGVQEGATGDWDSPEGEIWWETTTPLGIH